jgi:hypothetical protein
MIGQLPNTFIVDRSYNVNMSEQKSPSGQGITPLRRPFGVGVVGGSTVVIDYAGVRFVTDPTFDPPGIHGVMERIVAPALTLEDLGPVDVVLLSHDEHSDNFDASGRELALTTRMIVTGVGAATRLGAPAVGLGGRCKSMSARVTLADIDDCGFVIVVGCRWVRRRSSWICWIR